MTAVGESDPAILTRSGRVATITLNRPQQLNALNVDLARCLSALGAEAAADESVSVVIVRGNGRGFCAGGDIALFADNLDRIGLVVRELLGAYHPFLLALRRMPKLVITSVHGAAAGAGLSLALMGDLCIAAESARFRASYAALGVSPDGGGTVGLVDAVGPRAAMEIFLGKDQFSAREALAFGLVNRIVPEHELARATDAWAAQMAAIEPCAIEATKRLIHARADSAVASQLDAEMEALVHCMERPAFRERVLAFMQSARP